jgi:ribosomal protein S18 acetylase RimI-like enzyme
MTPIETTSRPARAEDLPAMRLVQGLALRDLAAREGRDTSSWALDDQPTPPMRYLLRRWPALSWVAIGDGQVIGFSQGFVHDDLWFLSNLFVHPDVQGGGIGAALLQKCLAAGLRRGARIRAVSSSPDSAAQALYARTGMIPRFPLFALQGSAAALRKLPASRANLVEVGASRTWIRRLGDLDEYVWGRRRNADHQFAHREMKVKCLAIGGSSAGLAGYVYYAAQQVGPLCARTPRLQLQLLRAAGDALGEDGAQLRVTVPGINATVLVGLLEAGFRIDFSNLFMASRPFGRFDRYVVSGGTLL